MILPWSIDLSDMIILDSTKQISHFKVRAMLWKYFVGNARDHTQNIFGICLGNIEASLAAEGNSWLTWVDICTILGRPWSLLAVYYLDQLISDISFGFPIPGILPITFIRMKNNDTGAIHREHHLLTRQHYLRIFLGWDARNLPDDCYFSPYTQRIIVTDNWFLNSYHATKKTMI